MLALKSNNVSRANNPRGLARPEKNPYKLPETPRNEREAFKMAADGTDSGESKNPQLRKSSAASSKGGGMLIVTHRAVGSQVSRLSHCNCKNIQVGFAAASGVVAFHHMKLQLWVTSARKKMSI